MNELGALLDAAYEQALAHFERELREGKRNAGAELGQYRRKRRDYASLMRLAEIPDEARELADRLLQTHGIALNDPARLEFERDVAAMLVRLYDAFIALALSEDQGSR